MTRSGSLCLPEASGIARGTAPCHPRRSRHGMMPQPSSHLLSQSHALLGGTGKSNQRITSSDSTDKSACEAGRTPGCDCRQSVGGRRIRSRARTRVCCRKLADMPGQGAGATGGKAPAAVRYLAGSTRAPMTDGRKEAPRQLTQTSSMGQVFVARDKKGPDLQGRARRRRPQPSGSRHTAAPLACAPPRAPSRPRSGRTCPQAVQFEVDGEGSRYKGFGFRV